LAPSQIDALFLVAIVDAVGIVTFQTVHTACGRICCPTITKLTPLTGIAANFGINNVCLTWLSLIELTAWEVSLWIHWKRES